MGEQRCVARSDECRRGAGVREAAGRDRRARLHRFGWGRRAIDRRSQREDLGWDDVREHEASAQTCVGRGRRSRAGACPGRGPRNRRTGVSAAIKGGRRRQRSEDRNMSITRRVFVKSGGLALFSVGLDPLFLARAAFTSYKPLPSHAACCRPVLVCLFQRGAVDGLNMIVPHGDPIYYQERPRIAVPEKDVLDLDGYFGLHPGLAALKPLWEAKTLAAIHAIGSPDATRSHFDAQDYMESGTPGVKATPDGWLNRYCQQD